MKLLLIGLIYQKKSATLDKALEYYLIALNLAEDLAIEVGSKESLKEAYEGLADHYAELNDYKDAFYYQELLTAVNDSLFKSANEKRLNFMLATDNLEKKEREVEVQELIIQKHNLEKIKTIGDAYICA